MRISKKENGTAWPYNENLKQVARIWRAYLLSEMADNFGPIPINGFQGVNPEYADVKTVYYHIFDELKDAVSKIDVNVTVDANTVGKFDAAYAGNFSKWIKYGNSLRLRLAMRLSEVDAAKAKAEFEDAVTKPLITSMDDAFQVAEKTQWLGSSYRCNEPPMELPDPEHYPGEPVYRPRVVSDQKTWCGIPSSLSSNQPIMPAFN